MLSNLQKLTGRIRGGDAGNYAENRTDEQAVMNSLGDVMQAQHWPPLADVVRLGESWQVLGAALTGLTALPTTVMGLRLWNGEPGDGKSYVIDSVNVVKTVIDVTTDDTFAVFAQQVRGPVAAITDAGNTVRSLSGRGYSGRARTDASVASSAVSGRWDIIGRSPDTATAIAGSAWENIEIPLRGLYVIPPGGSFGIHAASVTAEASQFRVCIRWHEVLARVVS